MRREPEVPEEKVPEVECLDGPARITSKELAPIHPVKSGTLQNACSTRPRVVADLGKSVNTIHPEPEIHEHIYVTKGYGTMCTTSSTFSPTLRPL